MKRKKKMTGYRSDKKNTVEGCKSISVTFLKKHGCFHGRKSGTMDWTNSKGEEIAAIGFSMQTNEWDGEIRFQYALTDDRTNKTEHCDCTARLTATPCNYGGKRWWFICTLLKNGMVCNRRVEKLYFGGKYFGCRHCHNLTYKSVQKHDKRIDALVRNPDLLLKALHKPNDLKTNLLAMDAMLKLEEKQERKKRS